MHEIFAAFLDLARPLIAAAGLGGAAWALGRAAERALGTASGQDDPIGRTGGEVALGLALLALLGFWLGIAGRLTLWGVQGGVAVLAGGLWVVGRREPPSFPPPARGGGTLRRRGFAIAVLFALPLLILALYPPVGFDALMYHLPFAKAFVATGGLPFLPDLRFPVFPQASEVLFAEAMLFGGDRAAQLVSLLGTFASAAILFGWGRRVLPGDGDPARRGALAAALFLGAPVVAYLSGSGYCEPLLVMFVVAAFDRIDRFESRDRPAVDPSRWLLAGAFAGSAAAVKYFGLFAVGAVVAVALFAPAATGGVRWRRLAWGLGGVLLFAAPWYVRNAAWTGNPVFPLFPRLFGASVWGGPAELAPWSEGHGLSQLLQMIRLPWTLTFGRPEFGRVPPWSPVLIVALAATLLAIRGNRRVRLLLLASLAYLAAFFFLPLDSRYLLPVLPLLCLATAASLGPYLRRHRLLLPAALALALAPAALWNLYQLYRLGPLPASEAARIRFLDARLPAYPALRFLARTRGERASVYAFYAENHVYYATGRFQGDWNGRMPFAEILRRGGTGDRLADELRARGVTHLLTVVASEPPLPRDEGFAQRFRPVYDDGRARVWEIR